MAPFSAFPEADQSERTLPYSFTEVGDSLASEIWDGDPVFSRRKRPPSLSGHWRNSAETVWRLVIDQETRLFRVVARGVSPDQRDEILGFTHGFVSFEVDDELFLGPAVERFVHRVVCRLAGPRKWPDNDEFLYQHIFFKN